MVNRIFPESDMKQEQKTGKEGARWYHLVIIALLFLLLANVQYDRANIRENSRLIEQLQERLVVKQLIDLKKGTTK